MVFMCVWDIVEKSEDQIIAKQYQFNLKTIKWRQRVRLKDRGRQRRTEEDRGGQRKTEEDRKRQRKTEKNREKQKKTEKSQNTRVTMHK